MSAPIPGLAEIISQLDRQRLEAEALTSAVSRAEHEIASTLPQRLLRKPRRPHLHLVSSADRLRA